MPVDVGVHGADAIRYYLGEFRILFGESRLHEKVRHKGPSAGPGERAKGQRVTARAPRPSSSRA